jgi:hypothetical protein
VGSISTRGAGLAFHRVTRTGGLARAAGENQTNLPTPGLRVRHAAGVFSQVMAQPSRPVTDEEIRVAKDRWLRACAVRAHASQVEALFATYSALVIEQVKTLAVARRA